MQRNNKNPDNNSMKRSRKEGELDELLKDATKITGGIEKDVKAPTIAEKPPRKKIVSKAKIKAENQPNISTASTHAAILAGLNQSVTTPALNDLADAALECAPLDTEMPEPISPTIHHSESSIFDEDGLIAYCGDTSTESLFESTPNTSVKRLPTALHKAVFHENAELLKQLLAAHQIPVDALDQSDFTALALAVYTGNRILIKLLLAAGANKDFGREVGMFTPMNRAYDAMFTAKQLNDTHALNKYTEVIEEFQLHNISLIPKF